MGYVIAFSPWSNGDSNKTYLAGSDYGSFNGHDITQSGQLTPGLLVYVLIWLYKT